MKRFGAAVSLCALTCASTLVSAQAPPAPPPSAGLKLNYTQGEITIGGGLARLKVPSTFRYLGPEDSQKVLVDLWGNPKGDAPLGMLIPADKDPDTEEGWGIILTFEEEGFVKDDDADQINYTDLLKEMQQDTDAANEERKKAGYGAVDLVGWATPPRYDKAAKKLYWAKELRFAGSEANTLNYNIRILGRRGVLVLNAVAGMNQLAEVQAATPEILALVDFQPGHRYADFSPDTDQIAAYGIGALIAGKAATKVGLFKMLVGLLVAGKKFVIIGLVALAAGLKRLFGPKGDTEQA